MFRLTLLAFLLTFVALSYTNPTGDLFELEEEEDYGDYEQGIFDNNPGESTSCHGRLELMSTYGKSLSAYNNFKIRANERRPAVSVQGIKVYGDCCWRLEERNRRWAEMFFGNQESNNLYRYIFNGIKELC